MEPYPLRNSTKRTHKSCSLITTSSNSNGHNSLLTSGYISSHFVVCIKLTTPIDCKVASGIVHLYLSTLPHSFYCCHGTIFGFHIYSSFTFKSFTIHIYVLVWKYLDMSKILRKIKLSQYMVLKYIYYYAYNYFILLIVELRETRTRTTSFVFALCLSAI